MQESTAATAVSLCSRRAAWRTPSLVSLLGTRGGGLQHNHLLNGRGITGRLQLDSTRIPSRALTTFGNQSLYRCTATPTRGRNKFSFTTSRVIPTAFLWKATQQRSLFIRVETTPNIDSLKFILDRTVLEAGTADFPNATDAINRSPLAHAVFGVKGVTGVFFGNDFITVTKEDTLEWSDIKLRISMAIQDFFATGDPVMYDADHVRQPLDTDVDPDDSPAVAAIKEILETRIRPAVQNDGGNILFKGFDEATGTVYLQLQGSCSGCSSSQVTLKGGVERTLMYYVPEVETVQAVDDNDELVMEQFRQFEARLAEQKEKRKHEAPAAQESGETQSASAGAQQ